MKDLKSTLIQHFIISASLIALVLTFLAAPILEPIRQELATSLKLPSNQLWLPMTVLLVALNWLSVKRLIGVIAHPLQRLAKEAPSSTASKPQTSGRRKLANKSPI